MNRRNFLQVSALPLFANPALLVFAQSSAWPERQVTFVSVSAPGGNSDVVSRLVAQKLAEQTKQAFVVENRPGASGAIASAYVAKAPADGYTLVAGSIASHAIYPLIAKVPFDPLRDFAPITVIGTNTNVLVVPANSPFKSVGDLLVAAKANPGTLSFASPGIGSTQHMSGELLQRQAHVKLIHIPNARGSVVVDVMAGTISMMFEGLSILPHVQGGKLRALAVTSRKRWPQLPDVPTMEEAGVPSFEVSSWQALYAPAATPKAVVEQIAKHVAAALATPDIASKFETIGLTPGGMPPSEFVAFQKAEIAKWESVVKSNGIKAE